MSLRCGVLLPGGCQLSEGINQAVRGVVRTAAGDVVAVCKHLPRQAFLTEMLCALLGRALSLPIPEPLIVIHAETQEALFGSVDIEHPNLTRHLRHIDSETLRRRLLQWRSFAAAGLFDEWIANADRHPGNILHDGGAGFWLIDHDQALTAPMADNQLMQLARTLDEVGRRRLGRALAELAPAWTEDRLEQAVAPLCGYSEIPGLMNFLIARNKLLADLISQRLPSDNHDLFA
jgi:hypothetical protein